MSGVVAPLTHLQEGQKLTADALPNLFEIYLKGAPTAVALYLTDGATVVWQGKTYEATACKITGVARHADGERPRPSLQLHNPFGIYNVYAFTGYFDGATVIRRRVLLQHLKANVNLADTEFWYISKIKELVSEHSITFDLRMFSDGPNQQIPVRMYTPPNFPFVTV